LTVSKCIINLFPQVNQSAKIFVYRLMLLQLLPASSYKHR